LALCLEITIDGWLLSPRTQPQQRCRVVDAHAKKTGFFGDGNPALKGNAALKRMTMDVAQVPRF
jgi:hypothetical protein